MSIVVFDPDSTDDVDWSDRMRHPAEGDEAGGMWLSDTEPSFIDTRKLRTERLARLRDWMRRDGYGAVVLFDPYNQRYATGSRNMFGYFLRNSTRYYFVPVEGPVVFIAHTMDFGTYGRDGVLEPGMCLSVESYIGEKGGGEGVKLEDQVVITETGIDLMSRFPYEDEFLSGEI